MGKSAQEQYISLPQMMDLCRQYPGRCVGCLHRIFIC